jgi:hypothetical protein
MLGYVLCTACCMLCAGIRCGVLSDRNIIGIIGLECSMTSGKGNKGDDYDVSKRIELFLSSNPSRTVYVVLLFKAA